MNKTAMKLARIYVRLHGSSRVISLTTKRELVRLFSCDSLDMKIIARQYARDIIEGRTWTCAHCHDKFPNSIEVEYEYNGDSLCNECYRHDYFTCDDCDTVYDNDERQSVAHGEVCSDCHADHYTSCSFCEQSFNSSSINYNEHDDRYSCDCCNDRYYRHCSDCDSSYRVDEEDCCPSCGQVLGRDGQLVALHGHDYKPSPKFQLAIGEPPEAHHFLGIELEVNAPSLMSLRAAAEKVSKNRPWLYCKTDGSIEHGIEVVFHPFTYLALTQRRAEISKLISEMTEAGFTSYKKGLCGLHVHVSKRTLSGLTIYKICRMVYENPELWFRLSRRTKDNLRQWARIEVSSGRAVKMYATRAGKTRGSVFDTRYMSLNLEPRHTMEFRMFRGTLDLNTFWGIIEMVNATVEFCGQPVGLDSVTQQGLWTWLRLQKSFSQNPESPLAKKLGRLQYPNAIALWNRRVEQINVVDAEEAKCV